MVLSANRKLLGKSVNLFNSSSRYGAASAITTTKIEPNKITNQEVPLSTADVKPTKVAGESLPAKPFDAIPGPNENRYVHLIKNFFPVFGKFRYSQRMEYDRLLHAEYGSLVRVPRVGRQPYSLYVYDPQAYASVYQQEGRYPHRTPFTALWKVIQDSNGTLEAGLTTLNSEEWFTMRRTMQKKLMHLRQLDPYVPSVAAITEEFIKMLQDMAQGGDTVQLPNVKPLLQQWNMEALLNIIFNVRLGSMSGSKKNRGIHDALINAIDNVMEGIDKTQTPLMLWRFLPSRNYNKLKRSFQELGRLTVKYANQGIEEARNKKEMESLPLFNELLFKYENEPGKLVGFFSEILMGGLHTTTETVECVLYFLSRNPEVQTKLYNEVRNILPEKSTEITADMLRQFRYVKACVKETLRFAPALGTQLRTFNKDITLCGYNIPSRTMIRMMFGVTSSSEVHFREASRFIPERWLDDGDESMESRPHPFASVPFGHGPRMCIGRRISEIEMHLLLIKYRIY